MGSEMCIRDSLGFRAWLVGVCRGFSVSRGRFCSGGFRGAAFGPLSGRAVGRFRLGSVVPPFASLAVRVRRGRAVFLFRCRCALRAVVGSAASRSPRLLRRARGFRWVCGVGSRLPVLAAVPVGVAAFAGVWRGLVVRSLSLFPSAAPVVVGFSGSRRRSRRSWPAWWPRCWPLAVRSRSVARLAPIRLLALPLPVRWCFPPPRSAPVAVRSPPGRSPWCGLSQLAVPVPASWCFPVRRAPLVCRLPRGRRPVSAGPVPALGLPPRSRLGWACPWSCFPVGSRLCPHGVLGFLPVLAFGRSVFGWSVSVYLFPFL